MEDILLKHDVSVESYSRKELIRFMMNNLFDAALLCKPEKKETFSITDFNSVSCRLLGYEYGELRHKNIIEIFTADSLPSVMENLVHDPAEDSVIWKAEVLTKWGKKIQVEVTKYLFVLDGGLQLLLSLRDISLQVETGRNLAVYRNLFEISESLGKIGHWEYDLKNGQFWASQGTRSILGLGYDELTIDDLPELGLTGYLSQIQNMINGLIIVNELLQVDFVICRLSDNAVVDIRSVAEYNYSERKIYGLIQDISDHKILEKELLNEKDKSNRSSRSRQTFISTMSDEIYAPLNRIVGYSQLMELPDLSTETKVDYREYINKSCNQLFKVITEIRDITKIDSEKSVLQCNQICISDLLNETLIANKPEADRKYIDLRLAPGNIQNDLYIVSDESMLTKVLSSLIDNAIQFTLQGYIEFGCNINGSYLEFFVNDTGIGLSSSQVGIISDLFCQADTNSIEYNGGRGLSLALSKFYLNLLGGTIRIDSKVGEGSTFCFTIPFVTTEIDTEEVEVPETGSSLPDFKSCLVMDEIEINYFNLKAMLSSLGFRVIWAKDCEEAIYMSINEAFDIVLMDLSMPDNYGYEAVKIIKKKRPDLPVFALSVDNNADEWSKAILSGFDGIMKKPVRMEDFLELTESIFTLEE